MNNFFFVRCTRRKRHHETRTWPTVAPSMRAATDTPPPPRVDAFQKRFFGTTVGRKTVAGARPIGVHLIFLLSTVLLLFTIVTNRTRWPCLWTEGLPVSGTKICKKIQTPFVRRPSAWAVDTATKRRQSTVVNGVTHENGSRFRKPFRPFGREYFRKTEPPAFRKAARRFCRSFECRPFSKSRLHMFYTGTRTSHST